VATVDSQGLVTAVSAGVVSITFQSDQCSVAHEIIVSEQLNALTITANGDIAEVCVGESVLLTASNFTNALWYKDDIPISDYPSLTLSKVEDSGVYTVKITNPCGTITSNSISVTVKPLQSTTKIKQNR
jgi:hypothetical protein